MSHALLMDGNSYGTGDERVPGGCPRDYHMDHRDPRVSVREMARIRLHS